MLAFSGSAKLPLKAAVYRSTLAHLVMFSQTLNDEVAPASRCSALASSPPSSTPAKGWTCRRCRGCRPRMSSLRVSPAFGKGEVVCAPGVEKSELFDAVYDAQRAVFAGQAPTLASRYRTRSDG
jgi:hypothetical protein